MSGFAYLVCASAVFRKCVTSKDSVSELKKICNYCRFASYSESAFHCFLLILRNTECVFVQVR